MLSVSMLGGMRLRHDDAPVTGVDTPRLQSLLAYMVLHKGERLSRAHLAFAFWPGTTESQARTNLRNLLHYLRNALPDAASYLNASVQSLEWRTDAPLSLDVDELEVALADAARAAAAGDSAAVREALERGVSLYQGDLLPSCYDDWIVPRREDLRQAYLSALERLVHLLERQGDYRVAIGYARRLLQHDPLDEATYRLLMRLHALDGDRAGALRVYHTCTTALQRELDVQPDAATREAYERLLGAESRPALSAGIATAFSPLVGREREWARLLRIWRGVSDGGGPHAVMLRGEAGIGKTRLAEDLLQWATRQGIPGCQARCFAAEGELAYAPVAAWLRGRTLGALEDAWLVEVSRLVPELLASRPDLSRPDALTEAWQRERLFEALSRAVLCLGQPLLLTIDDLQWCDRDSLEWLRFLFRFAGSARLLVIGTYRPEEIGDSHPLRPLLQALYRDAQVTETDLGPLDQAATRELASRVAGAEISARAAQWIFGETEGNPLFVIETVRAGSPHHGEMASVGAALPPVADSLPAANLPPTVRSVLEARLAQLTPASRGLAGLAAAIGREFHFALLAAVSGRDEESLVRELDELWRRRIVREHGEDAYDFCHDKLREVAYGSLSAARRRRLHASVARALEALHAADLSPVSRQVALHYERAALPGRAIPYYLRAAEAARAVFAKEDAIALLRRGLALVGNGAPGAGPGGVPGEVAGQLWEALGEVLELSAQHENALAAYQNALLRVARGDRIAEARLHRKAGAVMREQRRYAEALDAFRRAQAALGEHPEADDTLWWAEWLEVHVDQVWAYYWLARWPEMEQLVNAIRPAVQERGGTANRQRFLTASCLMHLRKERYAVSDAMLADSREALDASREMASLQAKVDSEFELGFLQLWRRDLDEAERHLGAARELAETVGLAQFRTLSLTYLTVLWRFRGSIDQVSSHTVLAHGAADFARMPDYVAAAMANQAWLAWRRRDLPTATQRGRTAMELWQQSPLVYPFQWQALWPLIGAALACGREGEAWGSVNALLASAQQRLPDALNTALEAATEARSAGHAAAARRHLERAITAATEMGYL